MRAIFQHELRGAFHGLAAYLFCAFLLVFVGVGAMIYNIQAAVANFEYVLQFVCIGLVVIVPVLTMRSFAEERRQKTDQLLYSLPLGTWDIVAGKYLALVTVFLVPMVFISAYPLLFSLYGEVYLPSAYGSLIAFLLLGAALIAAGIFVSSLTESQGFAAGIAIAAFLLNYYSVSLAEQVSATALGSLLALGVTALLLALLIRALTRNAALAWGVGGVCALAALVVYLIDAAKLEGLLPTLMEKLSLFERFYPFVNGIFDWTSVVFYGSVIVFFLFLTVMSLEKRRYN
ncbi:MAG: ABC transporter permease [Clostridiaceae bacterium]|nr:ABC transporter permease [Clostridiaceae bacterium]